MLANSSTTSADDLSAIFVFAAKEGRIPELAGERSRRSGRPQFRRIRLTRQFY